MPIGPGAKPGGQEIRRPPPREGGAAGALRGGMTRRGGQQRFPSGPRTHPGGQTTGRRITGGGTSTGGRICRCLRGMQAPVRSRRSFGPQVFGRIGVRGMTTGGGVARRSWLMQAPFSSRAMPRAQGCGGADFFSNCFGHCWRSFGSTAVAQHAPLEVRLAMAQHVPPPAGT